MASVTEAGNSESKMQAYLINQKLERDLAERELLRSVVFYTCKFYRPIRASL